MPYEKRSSMMKYKGGPLTQRSGSIGPDSYLFRVNEPGRRYIEVYIRVNRRQAYQADLKALSFIFRRCERVCRPDLLKVVERRSTPPQRMSATKFLEVV